MKVDNPNIEAFQPVTLVFETSEQWEQFRKDIAEAVSNCGNVFMLDDINQLINE